MEGALSMTSAQLPTTPAVATSSEESAVEKGDEATDPADATNSTTESVVISPKRASQVSRSPGLAGKKLCYESPESVESNDASRNLLRECTAIFQIFAVCSGSRIKASYS